METETITAEDRFHAAFREFYLAGMKLVEAWDDKGFNADEAYPLPEAIRPPMSLDEWLMELNVHYNPEEG
jgi:hypothetical protein